MAKIMTGPDGRAYAISGGSARLEGMSVSASSTSPHHYQGINDMRASASMCDIESSASMCDVKASASMMVP